MSYTDVRSYIGPFTLAAQNAICTASGQIIAGGTTQLLPVSEATFLCSIAGVVSATPTTPPAGVKFFVVVGTNTTTGQITPSPASTLAQSSASAAYNTFIPSVALAGGSAYTIGLVCTGTASATETIGASTVIVGVAPQFV